MEQIDDRLLVLAAECDIQIERNGDDVLTVHFKYRREHANFIIGPSELRHPFVRYFGRLHPGYLLVAAHNPDGPFSGDRRQFLRWARTQGYGEDLVRKLTTFRVSSVDTFNEARHAMVAATEFGSCQECDLYILPRDGSFIAFASHDEYVSLQIPMLRANRDL